MANNIQFTIGSLFNGEGFTKAQQAVKNVNNDVKQGVSAASAMAGAFAGMDGAASKTMQAMTGLVGALATFNMTAIAAQVSMLAINAYFGEMKEKAEAAKKQADELKASMEKAFSTALTSSMSSVSKEVKAISDDFDRITKQANDFAAALSGVASAEATGGVLQLQVDKLNALLEAHGEQERATIEASYNLKIAIQKSANIEAEWAAKVDAAHQTYLDAQNKIANIDDQIAKIGDQRRELEQTMLSARESGDKHWLDIQKQVTVLLEQEQALEQKKIDVESQLDTIRENEKKVKQEAVNAQLQATAGIREAELAQSKLNDTIHEAKVKFEAKLDAEEENRAATADQTLKIKSAADAQKEAADAAKALRDAELNYTNKLNEYISSGMATFDAIQKNVMGNDGLNIGRAVPVDVQKSIATTVADKRVDDAIRQGMVSTVKDMGRLQRQGLREARDQINKTQNQQLREAQAYKRLKEMNPKALASADKEFMRKYEKLLKANEDRKKDLEKAKNAVEDQSKNTEKTADKLTSIEAMMKKLGLS